MKILLDRDSSTCTLATESANVSVFSGELDVHGCDEHGDSRLPHLVYPRAVSNQKLRYIYIKVQLYMEVYTGLQQR
jgi:hypothetical protein